MKCINLERYSPTDIHCGYTDHILRIDLSEKSVEIQRLLPEFKERYIGGRGYGLKFIWDETDASTRYDSPENLIVLSGGPLCGDPRFPGSGKFVVSTISPLTDTFIDSNVGGHFGPKIKLCGFDAIVVKGISDIEVVLFVDGDRGTISFYEAPIFDDSLELKSIRYVERLIRELNGGSVDESFAAVGAGIGAKNSLFGIINSIYFDRIRGRIRAKQAGRGGTGTVMRHKGLRAIILKSSRSYLQANQPYDRDSVKDAGASLKKVISQMDPHQLRLSSWGTTGLVEYMDRFGILPIQNYQYGSHREAKKVYGDVFLDDFMEKGYADGCFKGCNLACAKGAKEILIKRGPFEGERVEVDGPEYETIAAVTNMGIFDPQFVMEYNFYCDQYGLDTISMGVSVGFLMECVQRGYLSEEDIGYRLNWGDTEGAARLLHETAKGEGFGKICSLGVHRAKRWVSERYAKRYGKDPEEVFSELSRFSMELKGLEFSMYIPKESLAQQGGYGFSLKGPHHDEAWLIFIDQVHNEIPSFEMKAEALRWFPLIRTWFNAVGLCKLHWIDVRHPDASKTPEPSHNIPTLRYYIRYLNATTGWKKDIDDIIRDSERLYLLQKLINIRNGKGTREYDLIPDRAMGPAFFNEYEAKRSYYDNWLKERVDGDIPNDPKERHKMVMELRREDFQRLCDAVYHEKGFNSKGIPLPEKLKEVGLWDRKIEEFISRYHQK